jgi:hypothetical protein
MITFRRSVSRSRWWLPAAVAAAACACFPAAESPGQTHGTLLGWNNLGMHCMDSDFSVFSILPPYNTVHAQLIDGQGRLVTNAAGLGVSYAAIADPDGSFNATSAGKGNFWQYVPQLFGVALPEDTGLPVPGPESYAMPGTNDVPQSMRFEPSLAWFAAYGVPIVPYDDAGRPNQYPMMRLTATNDAGEVLARLDVVLPVSDEMSCSLCHGSGGAEEAMPPGGWEGSPDPGRDYRLNILRLHDRRLGEQEYQDALSASGLNTNGLYASVVANGRPILCAGCHASEALPGSGRPGLPPLTEAVHALHAMVTAPGTDLALGDSNNRQACYRCHPGSVTRCLRGAMGRAVAADGSMLMQCQSCHGGMAIVGSTNRIGWLDEPNCQACHVGGADNAYGVIRFSDALTSGVLRATADQRFATNPNTPLPQRSLYRFSRGHGGLQCSACHGSTHAEFPTAHASDNVAARQIQGHAGVIGECTACHAAMPVTVTSGPHGMHPLGQDWLEGHKAAAEANAIRCRACHGLNDRGTVLSRMLSDRTLDTDLIGIRTFWRGQQVGCYTCHDGPGSENPTTKGFPVVANREAYTTSGVPVSVDLGSARCRIVSQPGHGAVAVSNQFAIYQPDAAFSGEDVFTFCATNDYNDSNLGTVRIAVAAGSEPPVPAETTRVFAASFGSVSSRLAFASTLARAYRIDAASDLTGEWSAASAIVWGRTDSTPVPLGAAAAPELFCRAVLYLTNPVPVTVAADSATNATYDAGWLDGLNGGAGWAGGWSLATSGGSGGGFFIGTAGQANMSLPPRAWGLWATSGTTAEAKRDLAEPLALGGEIALGFDNNWVSSGQSVGFGLQNSSGANLFEFYFVGGESTYRINDAVHHQATAIPWSGDGWKIGFQLVTASSYVLTVGSYSIPGEMKPDGEMAIVRFKAWNFGAGEGPDYDLFINELRVVKP